MHSCSVEYGLINVDLEGIFLKGALGTLNGRSCQPCYFELEVPKGNQFYRLITAVTSYSKQSYDTWPQITLQRAQPYFVRLGLIRLFGKLLCFTMAREDITFFIK